MHINISPKNIYKYNITKLLSNLKIYLDFDSDFRPFQIGFMGFLYAHVCSSILLFIQPHGADSKFEKVLKLPWLLLLTVVYITDLGLSAPHRLGSNQAQLEPSLESQIPLPQH